MEIKFLKEYFKDMDQETIVCLYPVNVCKKEQSLTRITNLF